MEAGVEEDVFDDGGMFGTSWVTGSLIQRFVEISFLQSNTASSAPNSPEQVRMWCSLKKISWICHKFLVMK